MGFDEQPQQLLHETVHQLENETPPLIQNGMKFAFTLLESYGWFLLIGVAVLAYLYHKFKPSYEKWRQQRHDWYNAEQSKKYPDSAYKIQMSMEESRAKLQQQITIDAEKKMHVQQKRLEEEKQRQGEEWDYYKSNGVLPSKLKPEDSDKKDGKNNFKPKKSTYQRSGFNALSGSGGGSSGYRPSRRNMGGG